MTVPHLMMRHVTDVARHRKGCQGRDLPRERDPSSRDVDVVDDALRQNEVVIRDARVLRVPVLGLL